MKKFVLFVDDDRILRNLIKQKLKAHAETFTTLLAADGVEAVKILKETPISLVVTDLHMPNMDGFALLAELSGKYPDIPVFILTAYYTPRSKKKVLDTGATAYIQKPFVVEDLVDKIITTLQKETEGGTLRSVSMEMFIQLIDMEQKTCTVRVLDRTSGKQGILFFYEGDLMDARVDNRQGNTAAYEIIAWDRITISIQNKCALTEKKIEGELQAILFDAIRMKDEATGNPEEFEDG